MSKTSEIERLLEENFPIRAIAKKVDVSKEWVMFVRYRYEARKYRKLYADLISKIANEAIGNTPDLP